MSEKEIRCLEIIQRVVSKELSQSAAADVLDPSVPALVRQKCVTTREVRAVRKIHN